MFDLLAIPKSRLRGIEIMRQFLDIQNTIIAIVSLLIIDFVINKYFTDFYTIMVRYIGPSILLLLSLTCFMNMVIAKTNSKRLIYLILLIISAILLVVKYFIPFYFKN